MWIIIIFLAGFWSGIAALAASLFGWQVWPVAMGTGMVSMVSLMILASMCQAASVQFPDKEELVVELF